MTDIVTARKRSLIMAAVRSVNTRPEIVVRRLVHGFGYRFRLHVKDLPGKPDMCFRRDRKVIFIHGCFWHCHGCKQTRHPSTNVEYWGPKIAGNVMRDRKVKAALKKLGWRYLVVWECQLNRLDRVEQKIRSFLK